MNNLSSQRGFSLMELIGVMAVIAILAGTLAPGIADNLNRAYSDAERVNMETLAESLQRYVMEQKQIPNANVNNWRPAIASVTAFAESEIEFNDKGYRRRLVFDPRFLTNAVANFGGLTQNQGLAAAPFSPRAMLISDLNQNVPAVANNVATFDAIWNQTGTPTIVESNDVIIERMHFGEMFHRVVLSNQNTAQPYYRIENGGTFTIPAAVGGVDGVLTRFVIRNSQVSLFSDPFPTGALEQVFIVRSDHSNRYQTDGVNWNWVQP